MGDQFYLLPPDIHLTTVSRGYERNVFDLVEEAGSLSRFSELLRAYGFRPGKGTLMRQRLQPLVYRCQWCLYCRECYDCLDHHHALSAVGGGRRGIAHLTAWQHER